MAKQKPAARAPLVHREVGEKLGKAFAVERPWTREHGSANWQRDQGRNDLKWSRQKGEDSREQDQTGRDPSCSATDTSWRSHDILHGANLRQMNATPYYVLEPMRKISLPDAIVRQRWGTLSLFSSPFGLLRAGSFALIGRTEDEMTDRRKLAAEQPPKPSKWPRTTRRQDRIAHALDKRQPDLTVVLENIHDPHNASAVLRSCDAVGVLRICLVYTFETPPETFARTSSASAAKWIEIERYNSISECYAALRATGFAVYSTAFTGEARGLYELDFTVPTAVVFGNEMRGLSEEAVAFADETIWIPMMGMVQSLNVSVACAVTLYEALRQRAAAGMYGASRLTAEAKESLADDWLLR